MDGPPCAGTACSKCRHARWHARVCTSVRVHPCRRMPHTAHRKPSERIAVNCSWYQSSSCCSKEDTARISQQEPEIRLLQSSRGCRDVLHMLMCSSCSPRQARAAAGSSNLHPDHGPHSHLTPEPSSNLELKAHADPGPDRRSFARTYLLLTCLLTIGGTLRLGADQRVHSTGAARRANPSLVLTLNLAPTLTLTLTSTRSLGLTPTRCCACARACATVCSRSAPPLTSRAEAAST